MTKLTIAVIDCGLTGYAAECMESALAARLPAGTDLLWVSDGAAESGEAAHPNELFRRVTLGKGASYGAGRNAALQASASEYLLLVDADILLAPDAPSELLRHLESHSEAIAAAAQLLRESGRRMASGRRFPSVIHLAAHLWFTMKSSIHVVLRWPEELPLASPPFRVDAPFGCCLMLRRREALLVGPFDEDAQFQFDTTDWFWRARKIGYEAHLVPSARAFRISPRLYGHIPIELFIAHQRGQYRVVLRNCSCWHAGLFILARATLWAVTWFVASLVGLITGFRSRRANHLRRAAGAVLAWHLKGFPSSSSCPRLESSTHWEALG